jgi:hypothetical protein
MANGWTPERRARQAVLIRKWKPWQQSTGPRTPEGKAKVSCNADKGGHRAKLRELARLMRTEDDRDPLDVFDEMERLIDSMSPTT